MLRHRKSILAALFTVALLTALGVQQRSSARAQQPPAPAGPPTVTYQGREIPNSLEEILDPKHTVLVVHELLNDFITRGGASDKNGRRFEADSIIEPVAELLAAARAKNVRVAHVRWTRYADGSSNADPQRRTMPAGPPRAASNIEGTWGWEAPEALKPAPGEWVFPKWRQNAFFSTQLDALMRWNGIKTMIIVGLGAEVGIVPTVTHATSLGYFSFAVEDCIVPSDPALKADAMKFIARSATVKNRKDIIDIWSKSKPRPVGAPAPAPATASAAPQAPAGPAGTRAAPDMQDVLDPKTTVLLVHEMLNAFVSRGGAFDKGGRRIDADGIMGPMAKLIETARSKKVRVAYVRWTSYADGSTSANAGSRATPPPINASQDSTIEGTWGWQIADPVKPADGEWVLRKLRPDAFFATPLDTLMRWNGIKTLVIVGVGAEVGVVPTLMSASNLGYRRVAVSDALRPTDPKRMDDAMRYIADHAIVKTSAEIMDVWRTATPTPSQ